MYSVTKKLRNFSAAHRLIKGYKGKCKSLHGHNYALDITITSKTLDQHGFVMDFDEIKRHFDQWVQIHWDHVTIVSEIDQPLIDFLEKEKQDYFLLPGDKNTTAECLSEFLFQTFNKILKDLNIPQTTLKSVRVFESETASASFSNDTL